MAFFFLFFFFSSPVLEITLVRLRPYLTLAGVASEFCTGSMIFGGECYHP